MWGLRGGGGDVELLGVSLLTGPACPQVIREWLESRTPSSTPQATSRQGSSSARSSVQHFHRPGTLLRHREEERSSTPPALPDPEPQHRSGGPGRGSRQAPFQSRELPIPYSWPPTPFSLQRPTQRSSTYTRSLRSTGRKVSRGVCPTGRGTPGRCLTPCAPQSTIPAPTTGSIS